MLHKFNNYDLYSSELLFLDGVRKGETWGLDNNQAYISRSSRFDRSHANTKFYLTTYQYFTQIGHWLKNVPLRVFLDERKLGDVNYDLVLATWESLKPSPNYDQYIIWINQETKLIEIIEYTIRDQFAGAYGTITFSDFKKIGVITVAYKQTITPGPENEYVLHQMVIENLTYRIL